MTLAVGASMKAERQESALGPQKWESYIAK